MNALAQDIMPDVDPDIAVAVQNELKSADWTKARGWTALAAIADSVAPASLVIYPEAMSVNGASVTIPADLTAHLTYRGVGNAEAEVFDQNFPTVLRFAMKNGRAKLEAIKVDLTPV